MSDPTNKDRSARIDKLLEYYATECKGDAYADESDAQDIITDIMHWCHSEGWNFDEYLETARMNFDAEIEEEKESAK